MTQPRSKIVDLNVTRWYHCIFRCVRQAFLISNRHDFDRKAWLDNRLQELKSLFAVSVAGFSMMDNHLHLLLRVDPDVAKAWTPSGVVQRWLKLYPLRVNRRPVAPTRDDLDRLASNSQWVEERRERLSSLSWFMKCLKEPFSRKANREEKCRGTFFEGVAAQQVSEGIEQDHWLVPIEDQRRRGATREGIKEGFTLGQYLMLVDCMSRSVREGKANIPKDIQSMFERLQIIDAERWLNRVTNMLNNHRFYGSFMSTSRDLLRRVASKQGVRQLVNTA